MIKPERKKKWRDDDGLDLKLTLDQMPVNMEVRRKTTTRNKERGDKEVGNKDRVSFPNDPAPGKSVVHRDTGASNTGISYDNDIH